MAHNVFKEKSPIRSRVGKQTDGLSNENVRTAEIVSCGCSLRSFHDNINNLSKPTKYKISQIWPLFRHEYAMPTAANKLDRSNRSLSMSVRQGFVRSLSVQHQRKSPVFPAVSMQRDNYVDISATQAAENEDEDEHQAERVLLETDYEDLIPMGTILCTSKGSPCCDDPLQCGDEASKDGPHVLESRDVILDKGITVRPSFSSRKRLDRSTSPHRPDDLYAAVEREFKRLGIYNERQGDSSYDPFNKEKMSVTSSPKSSNKHSKDDLKESDCQYHIGCPEQTLEVNHRSVSPWHQHHAYGSHHGVDRSVDDTASFPYHLHTLCHNYFDNQHRHLSPTGSINDQQEENKAWVPHEDCISASAAPISPYNVVERFVSLSNVLCKRHFTSLIRKSEVSIQRFTNYLIKAKQRAVFRENPSLTPHKHDITASMISSLMPKVSFQSPHHFKYGLQACISKVMFDHFDTQSYGGEVDLSFKINRQFMFLRAYYVLEALESCSGEQLMEINEEFQQFCHVRLEAMKRRVGWVTRWPSKLLQAFLLALKDVWVAHKLAFAFETPASIFFTSPRSPLDLEHMSPLLESSSKQSFIMNSSMVARTSPRLSPYSNPSPDVKLERLDDESKADMNAGELMAKYINFGLSRWNGVVQFSVFPGFVLMGEGVLQSIVYLQPRTDDQHDHDHPQPIL